METLYRKVAVSERLPNDSGYYFGIDSLGHREYPYFDKEENKWESIWETTHWLEEIPDNSRQIEKLEAEKAELLEALDNSLKVIEWYMENTMPESDNHTDFFNIGMNQRSENECIIQKHKQ